MADSTSIHTGTTVASLDQELLHYQVLRQVGHGSMGVVFEAVQKGLGRRVAIKVLPASMALRTRTVKRFLREAEAMGRLSHENIVPVHDVGSVKNVHFFCMKFVEGPPLDDVLRAGPLAIMDVVQIGIDVSRALAHAHARGVMHRDIKPANLLRDGPRVVLTDFGLARPLDTEDAGTMTESGDLVGTPLYMSPEQISGDSERVDGRADVWGLGVTLYELLTQRTPFEGKNAQGILHAILHKDPALLHRLRDDVPRELEAVILKCLEKDPDRRYSGAAALLEDLRAVRDGNPVSASSPRFFDPGVRWVRRHPVEAAVLASSLLVALVLAVAAQQVLALYNSSQNLLADKQTELEEGQRKQETAVKDRTAATALYEMSDARVQWAQGNDQERREAEERVLDLLRSLKTEEHPQIFAEALGVLAGWLHTLQNDDQVLAELELWLSQEDPRTALMMRAAVLTGLEHHDEALYIHRQRSRLDPKHAAPHLDAARIHRGLALAAREAAGLPAPFTPEKFRIHMRTALRSLRAGLELAVNAVDEPLVADLLIERARCLVDMNQLAHAREALELVLANDDSRVEARSLLHAVERKRRQTTPRPPPLMASTPGGPEERPDLRTALENAPELDTKELESASRGLQSIYRGLARLLRTSSDPAEEGSAADEPDEPGEKVGEGKPNDP